jgi:hypothetical protein
MYVYDESSWRIAYEAVYSKMGMVELYVKLNPTESGWNDQLYTGSQFDSSNVLPSTSTRLERYDNINQQEIANIEPIPTDNDDEDYNAESEENTDSADDKAEEDEEFFEADEEIDIGPNIDIRGSYNPYIGRGWVHPASSFHDSSQ